MDGYITLHYYCLLYKGYESSDLTYLLFSTTNYGVRKTSRLQVKINLKSKPSYYIQNIIPSYHYISLMTLYEHIFVY